MKTRLLASAAIAAALAGAPAFGAVDHFRIQLQKGGRGLTFPEGNVEKVSYFMYPYAEVDGRPLDYCVPKTFSYGVTFKED